MQTTTFLYCYGHYQHYDGKYTVLDNDFCEEITFDHNIRHDEYYDAHLAEQVWDYAYSQITEVDNENGIDTKVLERIVIYGYYGKFEVTPLHKYPSYIKNKYIVLDLNNIEVCDSLDEAHSVVEESLSGSTDILKDVEDENIISAIKKPSLCNLEQGDIEIYAIPEDELNEYKLSYCSVYDGIRIRNAYEPIEVYSGLALFKEEANRRGLDLN